MEAVMDHEKDQELVRRIELARNGDRRSWDHLIATHKDRVKAAALHFIGEKRGDIQIEDVLQETFLRAFKSIGSFAWQGEDSFLHWLIGIAKNVVQEHEKLRKRRPLIQLRDDVARDDPSRGRLLQREERFERLEKALETLSPEHREVIRLARIEGLPLKEVASRMNRTHGAVRQLLWRALGALKERFGDTESLNLPPRSLGDRGGYHGE
jgi:RNA polymerase sigma-70 factor, ECF subfamily